MTLSYCELNDGSHEIPNNLLARMLRLRHSCNPDFESQYTSVVKWYAEIDTSKARVLREIGIDESGAPIVFGPFGRNAGLWTGVSSSIGVNDRNAPPVRKDDFEDAWNKLEQSYRDRVSPKKMEPRIPVSEIEQIVGMWSDYVLQGLGSMSDQTISFLPDGTGFFEDYNVTLMYYDEFKWKITTAGRIMIQGTVCHLREANDQIVESQSNFTYRSISAECQVHHSGNGASVEVLYLPLANKTRPWVANAYGRCKVPISEVGRPDFT